MHEGANSYIYSGLLIGLHLALMIVLFIKIPNVHTVLKSLAFVSIGLDALILTFYLMIYNVFLVAFPTALQDTAFCAFLLYAHQPWQQICLRLKVTLLDESLYAVQQLPGHSDTSIDLSSLPNMPLNDVPGSGSISIPIPIPASGPGSISLPLPVPASAPVPTPTPTPNVGPEASPPPAVSVGVKEGAKAKKMSGLQAKINDSTQTLHQQHRKAQLVALLIWYPLLWL